MNFKQTMIEMAKKAEALEQERKEEKKKLAEIREKLEISNENDGHEGPMNI